MLPRSLRCVPQTARPSGRDDSWSSDGTPGQPERFLEHWDSRDVSYARRERVRTPKRPATRRNFQPAWPVRVGSLCFRPRDQGSVRSVGSRPSAITWPNRVMLKSSFSRSFKWISFNWLLAAFAETYKPMTAPKPELSM